MHFSALHKTYIFLKIEVSVEETIFFFKLWIIDDTNYHNSLQISNIWFV